VRRCVSPSLQAASKTTFNFLIFWNIRTLYWHKKPSGLCLCYARLRTAMKLATMLVINYVKFGTNHLPLMLKTARVQISLWTSLKRRGKCKYSSRHSSLTLIW
jgi:hypothetical protein